MKTVLLTYFKSFLIISDSKVDLELGVIINKKLEFKEHNDETILSSNAMSGMIMRIFIIR